MTIVHERENWEIIQMPLIYSVPSPPARPSIPSSSLSEAEIDVLRRRVPLRLGLARERARPEQALRERLAVQGRRVHELRPMLFLN